MPWRLSCLTVGRQYMPWPPSYHCFAYTVHVRWVPCHNFVIYPLSILIFSPPPFSSHYDIPVFITTITTSATQSAHGPGLSIYPVGCILVYTFWIIWFCFFGWCGHEWISRRWDWTHLGVHDDDHEWRNWCWNVWVGFFCICICPLLFTTEERNKQTNHRHGNIFCPFSVFLISHFRFLRQKELPRDRVSMQFVY